MLPLLIITYFALTGNVASCLTSSEEYSLEVVVPSYNFDLVQQSFDQVDNYFITRSQYSPSLITLLKETTFPTGLSIRLQIPTRFTEVREPHIKLFSEADLGVLRKNLASVYQGWDTICSETQCTFEKNDLILSASRGSTREGASLEINRKLTSCTPSCSGICLSESLQEPRCIDSQTKRDLDSLLNYVNLTVDLATFVDSYRIIGTEDLILYDIVPNSTTIIDWNEAIRQELAYLDAKGVVTLTRDDIESIASLAQQGQAGQNYRIVYDAAHTEWLYYAELPGSALTSTRDCRSYSVPQVRNISPATQVVLTPFYVIPFILTVVSLLILLILIIIARVITSHNRRRKI